MDLKEMDQKIKSLFKEWTNIQPLEPAHKERLDKKIRLEWNYNSNHIEGNTLTYKETALLLVHDRYDGNHEGRNYVEMKAHDMAVSHMKKMAQDKDANLTEADIRDLNKLILKEPFWSKAQTPDGKPTRKRIVPGRYKEQPNHVVKTSGAIHKFAEPWEVPAKMQELLEWFHENMDNPPPSIASFIAELHHRFITIHPFDDGNGRIVRLWVNYVLLHHGYPPIVVKSEDKENYYGALDSADVGDVDALAVYLGRLLISWLETGIRAAEGKDMGEPAEFG